MKKIVFIITVLLFIAVAGCTPSSDIECGKGTVEENGQCVAAPTVCDTGYHLENDVCIEDELICDEGYHVENDLCVPDTVSNVTEWFEGWQILTEPVGDLSLNELNFTETGFSVTLPAGKRVGIQKPNLVFEPGYSYEVSLDYHSTINDQGLFVQLQAHDGYDFTQPNILMNDTTNTFNQILPYYFEANGTNAGWLTIELMPSAFDATITISNISITKVALPVCGDNEVLEYLTCIPANNGYIPNGTPTEWFTGWQIMTLPVGDKEISDYDFTETGFTTYLNVGERTGIELLNYQFEAGYTYELSFNYTAGVAGRLVWVQMEALGGFGFTNTDTWTVEGTATFTQSLVIPDTYSIPDTGWIKIELAPGALDNVTIDQIVITKTAN